MKITENTFDVVISHIVIHNLTSPVIALEQMKRVAKINGKVVVIEPLPSSRNYYPTEEVTDAFDFLNKARETHPNSYLLETAKLMSEMPSSKRYYWEGSDSVTKQALRDRVSHKVEVAEKLITLAVQGKFVSQ